MKKYLAWFIIERWKVRRAVEPWMLADANQLAKRKEYYAARMSENFCSIRTSSLIRRDLRAMLQLNGGDNG